MDIKLFLLPFLLFLIVGKIQVSANIQSIILTGTEGTVETFKRNVRNLSEISEILEKDEKIKSICAGSKFSIWSVFFDDDFDEDDKEDNNTLTLVSELYGRECIEIDVEDPAKEPESFRHIGNINAYKSAISLYTEKNFNGHELYFDGTTLTLPEPIPVGSYGFTGVDRWEFRDPIPRCVARTTGNNLDVPYYMPEPRATNVRTINKGCPSSASPDERFHPPDPTIRPRHTPELVLYTGKGKKGNYFDMVGNEVRLPFIYNFSSATVNGYWQIFTDNDFNGETTCLNETVQDQEFDSILEVGSIKLGCGHDIEDYDDDDEDSAAAKSVIMPGFITLILFSACSSAAMHFRFW